MFYQIQKVTTSKAKRKPGKWIINQGEKDADLGRAFVKENRILQLDPGPQTCLLPRNIEMPMSVESSQFYKNSACWKLSLELYLATRKGVTVLFIFVLGTNLRTTNFVGAAVLYTFCLGAGFRNHPFLRGTEK